MTIQQFNTAVPGVSKQYLKYVLREVLECTTVLRWVGVGTWANKLIPLHWKLPAATILQFAGQFIFI